MGGAWTEYSAEELNWISDNRQLPRRVAHALFCARFERANVTFDNYKALCTRNGWNRGRTGFFDKGHIPDNKGKKMPYNANCARTQFKKGQLPRNTKYLGHERVSKEWLCRNQRCGNKQAHQLRAPVGPQS
jgi:hypothetical protein